MCARHLNVTYSFNNVYCVPAGCHALRWGTEEWEAGLWPSGHPQAGGSGQHVPYPLQLSSFDGNWHQGGLPGGGVWRTRRKTQWTCSPYVPVLGLCRRFLLRRGLGLPAIVPALGPPKPQGPCLPSNVSFSSPGPTAEDGPSHRSHLLAMEPTRPAPLSRYPKSYLDRQTRECQVGGGGDTSLFCFGYFKVLNSCLVSETSWLPHSVLHFEQCGGP